MAATDKLRTLRRRLLAGVLALPFVPARLSAQPRWLISDDERQQVKQLSSMQNVEIVDVKGGDPAIEIMAPTKKDRLVSPIDIQVRFSTPLPKRIDERSIAIKYGWFDITQKIRDFGGRVTAEGISLAKAPLKPDSYEITIRVANTSGEKASRTIRFSIE